MRNFFILLLLCALVAFFGSFFPRHKNKEKGIWLCKAKEAKISHPFVILIASYNNQNYYKKNLQSVLEQKYDHFRVLYIDDASTDHTGQKVAKWLEHHDKEKKVQLTFNQKNKGPLENFYQAIHSCKDEEILVFLDGDDWFAHDKVLTYLNRAYANPKVWMTYGNYLFHPSYRKSECKPITKQVFKQASYRAFAEKTLPFSHVKTAYAGLLKKIKKEDLTYNGKFFPCATDMALMFPALEMAEGHVVFVRDILYIYNWENPLNNDKKNLKTQQSFREYIRALPKYQPISSWSSSS